MIKKLGASFCLWLGVVLTAYWVSTPGDQLIAAALSGAVLVFVPHLIANK